MISVVELQKVVTKVTRDKVNTQEPPSVISSVTQVQPPIRTAVDKYTKVDTNIKVDTSNKVVTIEKKQGKTKQIDAFVPKAQEQGDIQIIVIDKSRSEESEDSLKVKEQEAIQALVTLPISGTSPTKVLQKLSMEAIPLQISAPGSSSSKFDKVTHYCDITLDEEIVIPKFDYDTMTIYQISILQQALEKKHQEIIRREHRQKQALQDIKDIFLDEYSLPPLEETKPLLEQLSDIVEKVNNEDLDTNSKLLEWSEKKFQSKINEKIASDIALTQVALVTKVKDV